MPGRRVLPEAVSAALSAVCASPAAWQDLRNALQRLRPYIAVVKVIRVVLFNLVLLGSKKPNVGPRAEEGGEEKKTEKENQLKRTKSRELRGGIMYYSCHCIKRNGLQHDCRRTGCGGEPACLVLPDPLCAPSQLARARGLADPAPLAAHMNAQGGGGPSATADSGSSGKRFIVCELKGMLPDDSSYSKSGNKCCKCPAQYVPSKVSNKPGPQACVYPPSVFAAAAPSAKAVAAGSSKCPCTCSKGLANMQSSIFALDEKTLSKIMKSFESKELSSSDSKHVGRGQPKNIVKEEPCTRPGCIHWKPPPPCLWDAPCKADCFETPVGILPGRNPLTGGGGTFSTMAPSGRIVSNSGQQPRDKIKLLTPACCTGCGGSHGQSGTSGAPAAGMPMLVMKLC